MQTTTLYDKLGGKKAVEQVVDDFYKRVLADNSINHFFAHTDMEKQRQHQTAFISYALGGSKEYTGRSMEKAHAGLDLQPKHFDAIVKHLGDSLAAHGVSKEDIKVISDRIATLKPNVLHK